MRDLPDDAARRLKWPLRLTWAGMVAERMLRAFWPVLTLLMTIGAALFAGLGDAGAPGVAQAVALAALIAGSGLTLWGAMRLKWPHRSEVRARLDAALPGQPLAALADEQAIGRDDAASRAVWQAHLARMQARLAGVRPVRPDLRLAARDPFALRYVALLALAMAAGFGSLSRLGDIAHVLPGTATAAVPGASWEGWIEPPAYTGRPSLYLADQPPGPLAVPLGSRLTLRFYGQLGAFALSQDISGAALPREAQPSYHFDVARNGMLKIDGPGGATWQVTAIGDVPPAIAANGALERNVAGDLSQPFIATDDYGVAAGQATVSLDIAALERRYGLVPDPEVRPEIALDLPMPFRGDRRSIEETLRGNFAQHPWAGLPVRLAFSVTDEMGQAGKAAPLDLILPGRRFLDPVAQALIEQRRDLLWSRDNGPRVARLLRALSHRPEDGLFSREVNYLKLRILISRLELHLAHGLAPETRDEIAQGLWEIAVSIEEGGLADALERLRRAQERVSEAMRQGASPEELAELMDELRGAMNDYLDQLAQNPSESQDGQQAQNQNGQTLTEEDLAEMMDRIEEMMAEGRMDEAQAMLDALQQMMENMQMAQSQSGQGQGQNPGEQSMEGLRESLREQQGLSDQAFRDLQEQRNPSAGVGESQGNTGRDGGQGQGQSHTGQDGRGQGAGDGTNDQAGQGQSGSDGADLSDRQQALADELERQRNALPGAGSQAGDAAREALDRAGRAMDGAADDLAQGNLPGALDDQAQAMEALREGMRNLDQALAQQAQRQQGTQGATRGQPGQRGQNDPLGRGPNNAGGLATEAPLADGEDPYRRARDLMDELRRRSGESERPQAERDYLRRLLEQF